MSDIVSEPPFGWGATCVQIEGEELDKIMQRMVLLGDPFDAMVSLLKDKAFPNEKVDIIHFIQLAQIASDEVKQGRQNARESFAEWAKFQSTAKEALRRKYGQ